MIAGLVDILASLTCVDGRTKGKKGEFLTYKHVLPTNVIAMAKSARVHTGERLCKRGLRHALDAGTPDVLGATLSLAKWKDEVCIILAHRILASFKSVKYRTSTAITVTDFLAVSCECRAGCKNHDQSNLGKSRIICSHCMTEPVQLSQCMFRGMAEQVLIALRKRIRRDGIDGFSNLPRLRNNIVQLIKATGTAPPPVEADATILEILQRYSSTTDRAKMSPGEPNLRDLGLLREKVCYCRPELKAENIINHNDSEGVETPDANPSTFPKNTPEGSATIEEYKSAVLAVDGLSLCLGGDEYKDVNPPSEKENITPIGFELLHYRATGGVEAQQRDLDYSRQHQPRLEMARTWRSLFDRTRRRGWTKSNLDADSSSSSNNSNSLNNSSQKHSIEPKAIEGEPPRKKRRRRFCCVPGCSSDDLHSKLSRVKDFPPPLSDNPTEQKQQTYRIKCFIRREWTERLGYGCSCGEKGMRICEKHPMEIVSGKSISFDLTGSGGSIIDKINLTIPPFEAPVQVGNKSFHTPPSTQSRGTGTDREIFRHALSLSQQESALSTPTQIALAREGLHSNSTIKDSCDSADKESDSNEAAWRTPQITLDSLTPDEVKRRTGFSDLKHMLSYTAIIYGGDLKELAKTVTKMTFLEEIVLAYEFSYGRSKIRLEEYISEYGCSERVVKKAIIYRLQKELECRKRWPMYPSFREDAKYRNEKWNLHFNPETGKRVVMHDTTNIPLPDPSSGDLNRALHNVYYNMCCAKAGVACLLCGWIFGLPLVTGHSDDDRQIADTMILELQKAFAENDPSSIETFLNIFDKGYHMILETQKHGQLCCQPDEAKSDEQFGRDKVLRTGCVAVVRSGNERAVNRCKMSWFLKRGCVEQLWDIDLLCDVWEAFTFRVNFMFDKFL